MRPASPPLPPEPPDPAMGVTVTNPPSPAPVGSLALSAAEIAGARLYVEASRAAGTQRAYAGDWRRFSGWCQARGAPALPAVPALVAVYLASLAEAGKAPPSIGRALAAIAHAYKRAGLVAPHRAEGDALVAEVLAGMRRSRLQPPDRKEAADADIIVRLLWSIEGDGLAALRDRAVIAFGMALAARRSELVTLDVADLAWEPQGLQVSIRRSYIIARCYTYPMLHEPTGRKGL